jgi:hypothetical protein
MIEMSFSMIVLEDYDVTYAFKLERLPQGRTSQPADVSSAR